MATETTESKYLPIGGKTARLFPGNPSPATLWRWQRRGVRGVRLQTWLIGGRRYTTEQAIAEFIQATTAAAETTTPSNELTSRPADIEQRLRDAGIL